MATFPTLSSGAVTQYPAQVITTQKTRVVRFLDGSDQRYLLRGRTLRLWQIQLDLLNETEIQQLEAFYSEQQGDYTPFDFPDPFSGTVVSNCRFGDSALVTNYTGVDTGTATLWVVETNG
jgi:hypothetical protein